MIAINVLADSASLRQWEEYWRSVGGEDVLFAEDARGEAVAGFNIRAAGTKIIIDRAGQIIFRDSRITPYEQLRALVERVL
ncbi:MAG: hypothetical protein A3G24_10520 [Betaproteobacteria bacterium RIFCSPLOWO2_12_FULL_62_13]|nr:MAG: hypothetical protein A3G24_10520 [Betaproteobacteria bacterium RIFCSPLOWO2_12_FULL_62_13]